MRRDETEIIEVFETDAPGFESGLRAIDATDSGSGDQIAGGATHRRRWIVVTGAAAVAAAVAISVTGGSPAPEPPRVAATTSSEGINFVTAVPLPSEQSAANLPGIAPRYVVANPPGYFTVDASEFTVGVEPSSRSRLWATPGSTGSSGQWINVVQNLFTAGDTGPNDYQQDSYRLAVGVSVATVRPPASASDTTTAMLLTDTSALTVETFGISPDALPSLLETAATGLGEAPVPDGYVLIVDSPSAWQRLQGDGLWSQYTAENRYGSEPNWLSVITTRSRPESSGVTDVLPFLLDSMRVFRAADGSIGVAGYQRGFGNAIAYWIDPDGWSVQVDYLGPLDQVIAIARTAYRATADEWAALKVTAPPIRRVEEQYTSISRQVEAVEIDDVLTQQTHLQQVTVGNRVRYSWMLRGISADRPGNPLEFYTDEFDGVVPTITTMSSARGATVLAAIPRPSPRFPSDAVLTVYPASGDPIVRGFTEVGPELGVLAATVIVEPIGAFTATITSAGGDVIAIWPPLPEL